ncbi:MAG: hypothetical protein AAGI11_08435 [Pseudomonadota bacterium]
MKRLDRLFAGLLLFGCSLNAFADCQVTGTTLEGGEMVECTGNDPDGFVGNPVGDEVTVLPGATVSAGGPAVFDLGGGANVFTMSGGTITQAGGFGSDDDIILQTIDGGSLEVTISGGTLNSSGEVIEIAEAISVQTTILISGGTLTGGDEVINVRNGNDNITITGGTLTAEDGVIQSEDGNDTIIVSGGTLTNITAGDETISAGAGNDVITITNATVIATAPEQAIIGNLGDDVITVGDGAVIQGLISGDSGSGSPQPGTDTLRFIHSVPMGEAAGICANLAAADPAAGSITINGLSYEWILFETIECDLAEVAPASVPTMTKAWLAVLMLGILGLVSLHHRWLAARR